MNTYFNLYIQLPAFWKLRMADKNIKPHHVILYLNLLLKWHEQHDNPVLHIKSYEMMDETNLGSRRTYFRYMRELLEWGYINGYRKGTNGAIVEMKFLHLPADEQIVS
ncbi:hypothetical protein SIO70_20265 [Chitinophaga sancti]|uniref:hypothetical protein n=1 Tax=Chitinophaga sancti TaxID=1004 RepID=UPI002A75AC97|nr:hypothetical protein [Chitinophaga sancti]WPQ60690.1 hypothetical protein SIO70_20265 [Chitinophaga sancti]